MILGGWAILSPLYNSFSFSCTVPDRVLDLSIFGQHFLFFPDVSIRILFKPLQHPLNFFFAKESSFSPRVLYFVLSSLLLPVHLILIFDANTKKVKPAMTKWTLLHLISKIKCSLLVLLSTFASYSARKVRGASTAF